MTESYIAGFTDGDSSIYINKQKSSLVVALGQMNEPFLNAIQTRLGSRMTKQRDSIGNGGVPYQLRLFGSGAIEVLELVARHGIVKAKQANLGLRYLTL